MANKKGNDSALNVSEHLNNSEAFFIKYKKAIIYAVAAVIIIVAGIFLYRQYVSEPRENEASTELAKAQEYFNQEMFDIALKGDSANFKGLLAVIDNYGGTDAANLANLYAGLCYLNTGKYTEAVKYLEDYSTASDAMVSPAAVGALGNAYVYTKQYDKAVETLKKAANMADSKSKEGANISLSPRFLIQAGEILENQGKKDEALKIYQDIKKKYVNSPVRQEIDKYIERVTK